MDPARASATAMAVAVIRDAHRAYDQRPWVLDDAYALPLVGPTWRDIRAAQLATYGERARQQHRAGLCLRSRYAEDRLESGVCRQYVLLGAGLDSFAWRRPDLLSRVRVFEVDHPATQELKRARIDELGLPVDDNHCFAPIDFEIDTLREGLTRASMDWRAPTLFSAMGVVTYLTPEAVATTLTTVSMCAAGSEIVFSYVPVDQELDEVGREIIGVFSRMAASAGEPFTMRFTATEIESLVERCGLHVAEHPTSDDLTARYFASRGDGLRAYTAERMVAAAVVA